MSAQIKPSRKLLKPIPPVKGSFPLDHEGLCKSFMVKYMKCMYVNQNIVSKCVDVTRDYLQCRMENELMTPEEWSKLGLAQKNA